MLPHWILHLLDPARSTCDDWCLHFWEVSGVWFTGIATFAAVATFLLLARREGVRLRISAGQFTILGGAPRQEVVLIEVKNVGSRNAVIEGVAWRRRPWGKQYAYQTFDPRFGPGGVPPASIEAGTSHRFTVPLNHPQAVGAGVHPRFRRPLAQTRSAPHPRDGVHTCRSAVLSVPRFEPERMAGETSRRAPEVGRSPAVRECWERFQHCGRDGHEGREPKGAAAALEFAHLAPACTSLPLEPRALRSLPTRAQLQGAP